MIKLKLFDLKRKQRQGGRLYFSAMLLGLSTGGAMMYFQQHPLQDAGHCKPAPQSFAQVASGEVAAFIAAKQPRAFPPVSFADDKNAAHRLDEFHGKTVLLNLWATWCLPCREELPALDALQQKRGGKDFAVVALSLDTDGIAKPERFFRENKIAALQLYNDRPGTVFKILREGGVLTGLPTSFLLDADGCMLGMMAGPADWKSESALKLIDAAITR